MPVETFGDELLAIAERMLELMQNAEGIGLAAPQVGLPLRFFICNTTGEPEDNRLFVNPELTKPESAEEADEGCLSIPDVTVLMRRARSIVMTAYDAKGNPVRVAGEGLTARVWQHEVDHLDGRLIIDNMSAGDSIANRKAIKQLEADFKPVRRTT